MKAPIWADVKDVETMSLTWDSLVRMAIVAFILYVANHQWLLTLFHSQQRSGQGGVGTVGVQLQIGFRQHPQRPSLGGEWMRAVHKDQRWRRGGRGLVRSGYWPELIAPSPQLFGRRY